MSLYVSALLSALLLLTGSAVRADEDRGSVYELDLELTDQSGRAHGLDVHRHRPTLITLFYGSCPMACPLLIDALRSIENALTAQERAGVRVLMVSIDPERDTPAALAQLARERRIDLARWTLARAEVSDVRLLAAALNIQYRPLPDGEFNHTSVITLLDGGGRVVRQTAMIGRADPEFVDAVRAALRPHEAPPTRRAESGS